MLVRALILLAAVLLPDAAAFGQLGALIYSQAPSRLFGYVSDTAVTNDFGQVVGSIYADRFSLAMNQSVGQISWFGLYGPQSGPIQEPPVNEAFRIRFYDQQGTFPSSPPTNILYEETFGNSPRTLTGIVSGGFPEYRFDINLSKRFEVLAGRPYWLEISQLGDPSSYFRWESSSGGERAFQFPIGSAWQLAGGAQLAYDLRVPEPGSGVLVGLVVAWVSRAGGRRQRPGTLTRL